MNKWILCLLILPIISGCSTTPSTPKPQSEKYTFHVIEFDSSTLISTEITSVDITEIINTSKANIIEYPIVYASVGTGALADETESISFPVDYKIVDGKVVAEEEFLKLGKSVEITLIKGIGEESLVKLGRTDNSTMVKADKNTISYQLHTYRKELAGYDDLSLTEEVTVKQPCFSICEINTQVIHDIDSWTTIGGLQASRDGLTTYVCVRVLPPQK